MTIVPVKWATHPTRLANPVQRPPLRVMQEQRAREAAQAMREYEANRRAVDAKTERLRALRLAKEAADTVVALKR